MTAAILLGLLGVPRDEIAADYHATAGAMAAFVDWLTVEYPDAVDAMTSQPAEYLEAPMRGDDRLPHDVDDRYGSIEGYVAGLGVPSTTVERLRSVLID